MQRPSVPVPLPATIVPCPVLPPTAAAATTTTTSATMAAVDTKALDGPSVTLTVRLIMQGKVSVHLPLSLSHTHHKLHTTLPILLHIPRHHREAALAACIMLATLASLAVLIRCRNAAHAATVGTLVDRAFVVVCSFGQPKES